MCASNVDFDALGHATEGFSGADIAEVCNRATRFAIKNCLRQHIARENEKDRFRSQQLPVPAELEADETIYVVTQRDLDFAMRNARKSVSEDQIAKYRAYEQANSLAQSRGFTGAP
jgi:transitional endoplasmic reticulum ATPase